jgi:signal transduction histidine kinase
MKTAPLPSNESARLEKLKSYGILDTLPEFEYDEIVKLASWICDTPISTVTLIDEKRQWYKAQKGLANTETSRDISFCAHAIRGTEIMIVKDATKDERFFDNPLVTGNPDIRFYAGMPLMTTEGYALGTLCVIDRKPKELTQLQLDALEILARQATKFMEMRRRLLSMTKLYESNTTILSVISHDILSPLNSLHGLISLLEGEALPADEFKELLPVVKSRITEVTQLLSQLLKWSSSQMDENSGDASAVNLRQVVEEIMTMNSSQFIQKQNVIMNEVDARLFAQADEHMVTFVLRNLVLNANKFSQQSTIRVSASRKDSQVEMCVSDEGVGIPPERLQTLFMWEHRQSARGSRGEAGSGIALLIAKEFMEKNGGSLRVESTVGKGTQFYFTIPYFAPPDSAS